MRSNRPEDCRARTDGIGIKVALRGVCSVVGACLISVAGCAGVGGFVVTPVGAHDATTTEPATTGEPVATALSLRAGEPVEVPFPGGRFRFESRSGKILLWVENSGGEAMQLSERTSVTDAAGRMRFYAGQTLPAGTSGRLVIPPPPGASELTRRRDASESRPAPFEGGFYPDQRALDEARAPSGRFIWPRGSVIRVDVVIERANASPTIRTFNLQHAS